MFEILDRRTSLTGNQIKILAAAIIGDALEFFDYFLIGFVLAFLIGPWKLTFGQSAIVLMSSGVGAIIGAYVWGWLADRIGRRKVFIGTVLNFSIATGLLYFTPDNGWIYLAIMRFFVGVGVGGLYCVDLPLVQEFMPSSKRGWVGGIVTCVIPLGVGLGAVMGALVGSGEWRLLFAIGVLPALLVLLVRLWVPESPRWLCRQGRYEEARKSLAWALQMEPSALPLPTAADAGPIIKSNWLDLFKYPRSLIVSWLGNAGAQTGVYGITLWAPSLFVLLLKVTPQEAAKMMILLSVFGFVGRLSFSFFSELMGRRNAGGLLGFGAGVLTIVAGYNYDATLLGVSAFWLILAVTFFFADGGFAIVGPYAAEVWPSHLRTSGMGSAYGFGGIGKIIGPVGLALIVGSSNYLKPDVPLPQIPTAFVYLGCWFLMAGAVYYFLGIETRGKSIEQIDKELADGLDLSTAATAARRALALDTLIATSADLAGDQTVIARAEAVRPAVEAASNEIESTRRLPPALLDKLHEARLFRLLLPRSSNGIETDPVTFFHVIETIARADASTAWCLSQAGGCAMSAAYLDLPVAHAIFGNDPRAVLAWGPGPKVRAVECEGGYKVTGVWSFASGGRHATWLGAHCPIYAADGSPKRDANGEQQERTMLVRTEDVAVDRHLEHGRPARHGQRPVRAGRLLRSIRPFDHPRIRSGMPRERPALPDGLRHLLPGGLCRRRLRHRPRRARQLPRCGAQQGAARRQEPAARQCRGAVQSGPGRSQSARRARLRAAVDGRHLEGALPPAPPSRSSSASPSGWPRPTPSTRRARRSTSPTMPRAPRRSSRTIRWSAASATSTP